MHVTPQTVPIRLLRLDAVVKFTMGLVNLGLNTVLPIPFSGFAINGGLEHVGFHWAAFNGLYGEMLEGVIGQTKVY